MNKEILKNFEDENWEGYLKNYDELREAFNLYLKGHNPKAYAGEDDSKNTYYFMDLGTVINVKDYTTKDYPRYSQYFSPNLFACIQALKHLNEVGIDYKFEDNTLKFKDNKFNYIQHMTNNKYNDYLDFVENENIKNDDLANQMAIFKLNKKTRSKDALKMFKKMGFQIKKVKKLENIKSNKAQSQEFGM